MVSIEAANVNPYAEQRWMLAWVRAMFECTRFRHAWSCKCMHFRANAKHPASSYNSSPYCLSRWQSPHPMTGSANQGEWFTFLIRDPRLSQAPRKRFRFKAIQHRPTTRETRAELISRFAYFSDTYIPLHGTRIQRRKYSTSLGVDIFFLTRTQEQNCVCVPALPDLLTPSGQTSFFSRKISLKQRNTRNLCIPTCLGFKTKPDMRSSLGPRFVFHGLALASGLPKPCLHRPTCVCTRKPQTTV